MGDWVVGDALVYSVGWGVEEEVDSRYGEGIE